ncbi:MAG: hypothetical protein WDN01_01790 [Rhizomicrobium sp.]
MSAQGKAPARPAASCNVADDKARPRVNQSSDISSAIESLSQPLRRRDLSGTGERNIQHIAATNKDGGSNYFRGYTEQSAMRRHRASRRGDSVAILREPRSAIAICAMD